MQHSVSGEESPRLIAVLTAQNVDRLRQPIAGVSAMSRILIEASLAGVREAVIAADDPGGLVGEVAAELRRAGSELMVAWVPLSSVRSEICGRAAGQALVLTGSAIVRAGALQRLCAVRDLPCALEHDGQLVAARLQTGGLAELAQRDGWPSLNCFPQGQRMIAAGEDVLPLDQLALASRRLLKSTGKATDGLVSRFLNRPVSQAISGVMLRHIKGLRPIHATGGTLVGALAMFAALALGGHPGLVLGCLLFHFTSMFDGVDGEIARATYRSSQRGAALDTAVDMATNLLFALGLTLAIHRTYGAHLTTIAGLAFAGLLLGVVLMSLVVSRSGGGGSFDVLKAHYAGRLSRGVGPSIVLFFKTITSRDFFAFLFAALAVLGLAKSIPWFLLVGAGLWLTFIVGSAPMALVISRLQPAPLPAPANEK